MLPTSAFFIIMRNHAVLLIKGDDGRWSLPGGNPWDGCEDIDNFKEFLLVSLLLYFDNISIVGPLEVILSTKEEIVVDDIRARCTVFACTMHGHIRTDAEDRVRFFKPGALVPQILAEDMCPILNHPKVQSRLL